MSTANIILATQNQFSLQCLLIDITLDDTTYYMSTAYQPVTFAGNTYTELGAFITVDDLRADLKATNGDIAISLAGVPSEAAYMDIVLSAPIKGGTVVVRRAFFNTNTLNFIPQFVFERYRGVITNFSVDETENFLNGELNNRITITCASLHTLLEQKRAGQRTNGSDRRQFFPGDISFDRVSTLQNTSFDFGKEYSGGGGFGGYGGGGGGGGSINNPGGSFFDDLAAFDARNRP